MGTVPGGFRIRSKSFVAASTAASWRRAGWKRTIFGRRAKRRDLSDLRETPFESLAIILLLCRNPDPDKEKWELSFAAAGQHRRVAFSGQRRIAA
jgi:hypothetical protein